MAVEPEHFFVVVLEINKKLTFHVVVKVLSSWTLLTLIINFGQVQTDEVCISGLGEKT